MRTMTLKTMIQRRRRERRNGVPLPSPIEAAVVAWPHPAPLAPVMWLMTNHSTVQVKLLLVVSTSLIFTSKAYLHIKSLYFPVSSWCMSMYVPCYFLTTSLACNRRYKTAASLKAHRTQYHGGQPSSRGGTPAAPPLPPSASESRIPVILPPPPNLLGKEDAKPNPYCDFCLGEDHMNNKTKQPEKMVSCANCGRSGE